MAENSYSVLKGILAAKLAALVDGDSETIFAQVATSNITEPDGYPLCYVMERGGDGHIVDTHRNERRWEFSVVVHYALGNKTEEQAQTAILETVDAVVQMFDRDPQLVDADTGFAQCKRVEVAKVLTERVTQDVAVIRSLMTVSVFDLVQRYA